MIKVRTLGMFKSAKVKADIVASTDVKNQTFYKDGDDLYFIDNAVSGDDAFQDDVTLPAGKKLNGYLVKAWEGQELVVDGKHVTGGVSSLADGAILVYNDEGGLKTDVAAGVHFVVTGKTRLTEAAVIVKVAIV